jgi:hypothetical protein
MLNKIKYDDFCEKESLIKECYVLQDNGFYKLNKAKPGLREAFERLNFSALNFTDSRSVFQFYNLAYLYRHINFAIDGNIPLLHLAVEPIAAGEIQDGFVNEISPNPFNYDFRTKYFDGGYIFNREKVLSDLREFIRTLR